MVLEHPGPGFVALFETFAGEQGAGFNAGNQGRERMRLVLVHAAHEMVQVKFTRIFQTCGLSEFQQGVQGVVVKVFHSIGFGLDHQGHLSFGILCRNPCGAVAGVASLRLDAANGEHEAPCTVAPVGTQCHGSCHVKGGDDLATRPQFDLVSQVQSNQGVVHQSQTLLHGRAHVI